MKKGEIYEGIIEKVDFPNKGYVHGGGSEDSDQKRNSRTESTFYDPEEACGKS